MAFPRYSRALRVSTALSASLLAPLVPAFAQAPAPPPAPAPLEREVIIVTGAPVAQDAFLTPADVDAIAGAMLEENRGAGLGQTLDVLPGVNLVATGHQVGNPVIRGLSGNRIRVLSDGIGLNFQQYGARHPANLDPYLAERIEIVRGPASLQYGGDAIGGAVNVISRLPPATLDGRSLFEGELAAGYSTGYEAGEAALTLAGALGGFGVTGTLVARESDGMRTPDGATAFESGDNSDPLITGRLPYTDYRQLNGALAVGYEGERLEGVLRWERYDSEQNYLLPDPGAPGAPVAPGGLGQELENDIVHARLSYALNDTFTLRPQIAYVRNVRRANAGGADPIPLPVPDGVADTDITRDSYTGRLILEHGDIAGFEGQIGVELLYEEQESRGATRLTPGGLVRNTAVYVFEAYEVGAFTINAGLRYDDRALEADPDRTANLAGLPATLDQRDHSAITGGVGVSYQFTENLVAAGNVRTAFRAPDLFELYANGQHNGVAAIQIGDPDLTEENAVTIDGSLRWRSARFEATLTAYYTDFDGYITLAGTGETHPVNGLPIFTFFQDDAVLTGGDVELLWRPARDWELGLVIEMVRGEFNSSDDDLPLLPADTVHARVRRDFGAWGALETPYLEASARYAGAREATGRVEPFYQFDLPSSAFGTASTDEYTLVDLAAGADIGAMTVRFEVNNAFDTEHRDFLDTYKSITLGPGRDFRVSAVYRF